MRYAERAKYAGACECQSCTLPILSLPSPTPFLLPSPFLNQHFHLFPWKAQALEGL